MMRSRRLVAGLAAIMVMLAGLVSGCGGGARAGAGTDPASGLPWITPDQLPEQARQTLTLIDKGGPFPYDKDGATFGNREGILPDEPRGFYREYTVPTPGEGDRGARRIVTGDHDTIFYYTDDHYDSFSRIRR